MSKALVRPLLFHMLLASLAGTAGAAASAAILPGKE